MKRIVLFAVGSRGDVEPTLALGVGLRARGYAVRLAALDPFRDEVASRGLEFASLGELPARFRGGGGPSFSGVAGRVLFWTVFQSLLGRYLPAFAAAAREADLVVHTGLAFPACHAAEALGVPCAALGFVPGGPPTSAFLHPLFASRSLSRGPACNRASFVFEQQLMVQSTAHHVARFRAQLKLPPLPRRALAAHRWQRTDAVIAAVSPQLVPRPPDWDERVHLTGPLFLDEPTPIDPALRAFVEDGPPPVYVGFGSMSDGQGARLAAAVVSALGRLGMRGVLATGWGGLSLDRAPAHVFVTSAVPHRWLFERVCAAIHHGGAGTTAAALRAGLPSLVVPFDYDQRFWGRLLAERGLGPEPIAPRHIDVERLSLALSGLETWRERVAPVAEAMRREDGVAAAIAVLERL